jgi:hypothetical protein
MATMEASFGASCSRAVEPQPTAAGEASSQEIASAFERLRQAGDQDLLRREPSLADLRARVPSVRIDLATGWRCQRKMHQSVRANG